MPMKTPGVYVVEKSAFPNSVVQVATAVPAFIGYTQTAMNGDVSLAGTPWRIASMTEFHLYFGGAPTPIFNIREFEERTGPSPLATDRMDDAPELPQATFSARSRGVKKKYALEQTNPAYAFYGAMRLFFQNGGGPCYVTSIGSYEDDFDADAMLEAISRLKKEPEPTMLVIPETTRLSRQNAAKVQQAMLMHCGNDMKNRFAILDISAGYLEQMDGRGDPIGTFRTDIGGNNLDFGAAYYPWLNTSIFQSRDFTFENIHPDSRAQLRKILAESVDNDAALSSEIDAIERPLLSGDFTLNVPAGGTTILRPEDLKAHDLTSNANELIYEVLDESSMPGTLLDTGTGNTLTRFSQADLDAGNVSFEHDATLGASGQFSVVVTDKDGVASHSQDVVVRVEDGQRDVPDLQAKTHDDDALAFKQAVTTDKILRATLPLYSTIMNAIADHMNVMSPGTAMAGLYTMVDNSRGVWKAPANVSVNSVKSPVVFVDHEMQADLNVSTTGKSINAIRPFVGEGTLVWGARTLDGNSLDWRYINVRRTMIMLEESIRCAAKAYVFEPNTAETWTTMRSMIENFLTSIWKQGGLAGASPDDAFSVRVGLGDTMTPVDILEGILKVTVLVAVTRPAEFIEITFQQEMQKS